MPETQRIAKIAVSSANYSFDKPFDYLVDPSFGALSVGQRVIVPFGNGNKPTFGFVLSVSEAEEAQKDKRRLKSISYAYSDEISLSSDDISLALWMRNKYFTSFFDCANLMIPPVAWQKPITKYSLNKDAVIPDKTFASTKYKDIISCLTANTAQLTIDEIEKEIGVKKIEKNLKDLVKQGIVTFEHFFVEKSPGRSIKLITLNNYDNIDVSQLGRSPAREMRAEALDYMRHHESVAEKELIYQTGVSQANIKWLVSKGYLSSQMVSSYTLEDTYIPDDVLPYVLSQKQDEIYRGLKCMIEGDAASCALLQGITGSGKTAIYIELIRDVISKGKTAIMLVPEIALTPQIVRLFKSHFGSEIALFHSNLPAKKREEEYMRVKTGRARVVIGTRSAIFAPCDNIGIIILDEEHDGSYKSSESLPRYDAAQIAKYRCVKNNCLLLLASATPSIESYYNAVTGKYTLFTLNERYSTATLPQTIIADMKIPMKDGDLSPIGPDLREQMAINLERGEQTILFLNRRGNARMAMCVDCGFIPQCKNCTASLTYHSANGRLMCHHCGYSEPLFTECPECGKGHVKLIGSGTQRIEEEIMKCFPTARVLRMDADTTTGRRSHEEILDIFGENKADILLGTQMVTKGLDFPNVTLVGVLDADLSLYSGNFLATERTFSLISQVVGRAGRSDKPGRAVIQTLSPNNTVIETAAAQDYQAFYQHEISVRELINVPPFCDIFTFTFSGEEEERVFALANQFAAGLNNAFKGKHKDIASPLLGPVPAILAVLNNKYRYVLSFRGQDNQETHSLINDMLRWYYSIPQSNKVTITTDINTPNY